MLNGSSNVSQRCFFKILEELIEDHRRELMKKTLLYFYEKIDKNLAVNERFVEETIDQLLDLRNLSLSKVSKILNCSLSMAEEFSNKYLLNHNEYYRT